MATCEKHGRLREDLFSLRSPRSVYERQGGYVDKHRYIRVEKRESFRALERMWRRASPAQGTSRLGVKSVNPAEFKTLADQWRRETRHVSSVMKIVMHPAYQRIMTMGEASLPLIFKDLQATRSHWLWALHYITGKDPATVDDNYNQAVDAWLQWGRKNGHLA